MPLRRATRASRDIEDERDRATAQPCDQERLRQMVQEAIQQITQEAARQAAQEAARVAAQEVAREMAAVQPGQQMQECDETLIKMMGQMRNVDLEPFSGALEAVDAHDWKRRLVKCLQTINCPPRLCLNIAELYLRGDAADWWDGVQMMHRGPLTFEDFLYAFDKKYFPREILHQKKNAFEHLSQGTRTVREYEREFSRLRRFAGNHMDEEDLIRRFLDGLRIDLRGRCSVITYTSLEDLVEKAVIQETCIAEEQKFFEAVEHKSKKTSELQVMTLEQSRPPRCPSCQRNHYGECNKCHSCGRIGHMSRNCRFKQVNADYERRIIAPEKSAKDCYRCGQPGHFAKDCMRGDPAFLPRPKRQATNPRVFAIRD